MKEVIVMVGSILLACLIFDMIAGDEASLKVATGEQMKHMLQWYQE